MPLNPPSGNMYEWAWTWSPLGGPCLYACKYCYVKKKIGPWLERMGNTKYVGVPRLIEKELRVPLVKPDDGKVIFVQSNGDLFGYWVWPAWIRRVLNHCRAYPQNTYLFQTKNPIKFQEFVDEFPPRTILGTTIETNRNYRVTMAPTPSERQQQIAYLKNVLRGFKGFKWMVSIEPIMDFDVPDLKRMIWSIHPVFVSIGADSGRNKLPEPSAPKLKELIRQISKFTEVRVKKNLKRLFEGE